MSWTHWMPWYNCCWREYLVDSSGYKPKASASFCKEKCKACAYIQTLTNYGLQVRHHQHHFLLTSKILSSVDDDFMIITKWLHFCETETYLSGMSHYSAVVLWNAKSVWWWWKKWHTVLWGRVATKGQKMAVGWDNGIVTFYYHYGKKKPPTQYYEADNHQGSQQQPYGTGLVCTPLFCIHVSVGSIL